MEEEWRVFLIGDSLFAESVAQILETAPQVRIVGTAVLQTLEQAVVKAANPHVLVVTAVGQPSMDVTASLFSLFPDIPIINADLNQDYVQVITSRRVGARRTDLLAAVQELTRQSSGRYQ